MTTKLYSCWTGLSVLLNQLWLSVSSVSFYQNVQRVYSGYGIKYLFTLSFISAILYCSILLNTIINFKDDFAQNKKSSDYVTNLEYTISQFPDLKYDGNIIHTEETPTFIYNNHKGKVAVIDSQNKLDYNQRSKIPIILTSNKILVSFLWDKNKVNFPIDYKTLFGTEQRILTKEVIKARIITLLNDVSNLIIYAVTPVLILFILVTSVLRACLLIFIVYIGTQLIDLPIEVKTCIRLSFFASGVHTFLTPLINIIAPSLNDVTWITLILPSILLFLSILKTKNSSKFPT